MPFRKISFTSGEFFHIYNRGNSKQVVFHDEEDKRRFVQLLFLANGTNKFKVHFINKDLIYDFDRGEALVHIGAYCLMPNHFHLLVTQTDSGSISKFMQKLTTGYSMYYNNKYEHAGALFEGKFKAEHANQDTYLKYLFSYIHLNPIKLIDQKWKENGMKDKTKAILFLKNYFFSSYPDYLEQNRPEKAILNTKVFPGYFSEKRSIEKEMFEWLGYK